MKIINWIRANYILLSILIFGAFFRFYHLDFQSLWLDETITVNDASPEKSFSEIYDSLMLLEPHPPLYFLLVHFCFKIFGYTSLVVRMFSAIIGIIGIFSVFLLGKEIFNKKVGYYAAILLSINYFHIYYSQEARMYSLLFLTTSISFYFLIKFIKSPTTKSNILFCIFSTLMIYTHFFALFAFVAQYLILLYFVLKPYEIKGIKFFKYCFLSGISSLILYLPTYGLFQKTSEMKSIWIQMPSLEVYTQFFKDFFGNSEIVIILAIVLIILFFVQLSKDEGSDSFKINPEKDKIILSFLVVFVWITITLLFPLIRTYTNLPMLINRYFINILPAVLITIAIGLYLIKNTIVRNIILSLIIVFSITDICIVKKYYSVVTKTQFREVSDFVVKNNPKSDPVVSNLSWHLPFYLNNNKIKTTLIDGDFDDYVNNMIYDTSKIKSFWYVGVFGYKLSLSDNSNKFLEANFAIPNSTDLFDSWAKHYVLKSNVAITIPSEMKIGTLTLSNINDEYWQKGIGVSNNILLVDYSSFKENMLKTAKKLKFKDGKMATLKSFEIVGNYIHIQIEEKTSDYIDVAAYPNTFSTVE